MRFKPGDIIVSPHYPDEYGYIQSITTWTNLDGSSGPSGYHIVWTNDITIEGDESYGTAYDVTLDQYVLHRLATLLYGD
jgi:hypothetical protein